MIKWEFPSSNYGEIKGFNDSGLATFGSNSYRSLAREICQNSLDAGLQGKRVKVEFSKFNISSHEFPGYSDFKQGVEKCLDQTKHFKNDKKASVFFSEAIQVLNKKSISFLRISDYNTKGLLGSRNSYNTDWINLVKASGSSDKGGQSGGSFGIGKSAPFVCSNLRTVFYSTLDIEGFKAYQGIAKLISFPLDKKTQDMSQGTGFYGETNQNQPVYSTLDIGGFSRAESGTDIFIAGFIEDDNWEEEIVSEIIGNYFYAIYKDTLEVVVGNTTINSTTIRSILDKSESDNIIMSNTKHYYEVLTSQDTVVFTENLCGYGDVQLQLLVSNDIDAPKKIAMIRKPWMKIKDYRQNISMYYSGIFLVLGEELNSFLRRLENPAHNDWEYGRLTLKQEQITAKRLLVEMKSFIKDKLLSMIQNSISEEESMAGLDDILPMDDDAEEADDTHNEVDYLNPVVSEVKEKKVKPIINNSKIKDGDYIKMQKEEDNIELGLDVGNSVGTRGTGKKKGKEESMNPGSDSPKYSIEEFEPEKVKFMVVDKKTNNYKLVFSSSTVPEKFSIKIYQLDEQGSRDLLIIGDASCSNNHVEVKNNILHLIVTDRSALINLDLIIKADKYFSVEVVFYEVKK